MNEELIFDEIFKTNISREGSSKLLEYLHEKSDFFTAPASSRYHCAFEGGLLKHSLNVYYSLVDYLARPRVRDLYNQVYSNESIAIVSLLHDICKTGIYKKDFRNKKNAMGKWEQVPMYTIDDELPYGHGEKSVYMISGFMRLTRDEAMAIRWHMGFSGPEDDAQVGSALSKFGLALALSTADMESTCFLEKKTEME